MKFANKAAREAKKNRMANQQFELFALWYSLILFFVGKRGVLAIHSYSSHKAKECSA